MRRALAFVLLAALGTAGCDSATPENIERWKTTQKGPGKLEAAVRDGKAAPEVRAQAVLALVDIGMAEKAEEALAGVPGGERGAVVTALVPRLTGAMKESDPAKARDARDTLFSVREYAAPADQQAIDGALLPSIEKDLRQGRTVGGRHSVEKIVAALGPKAMPLLVTLLEDPLVPFPPVVEVLSKAGDDASKAQGGTALVKRAAGQNEMPVAFWRALGSLQGSPEVTAFLLEKIKKGPERDAVSAAQVLQQGSGPALAPMLPVALAVAGDRRASKTLREEMFGVVEHIGGAEAQAGLLTIIGSDPTPLVRYRAFEAALAVGKEGAIQPALEALPPAASYEKEDVVDFLVKDIVKLGANARPAVISTLGSRSALARMTAVLALETPLPAGKTTLGTPAEAPAVEKLGSDKGVVKGFPKGATIGKEAARVAAVLKGKAGS